MDDVFSLCVLVVDCTSFEVLDRGHPLVPLLLSLTRECYEAAPRLLVLLVEVHGDREDEGVALVTHQCRLRVRVDERKFDVAQVGVLCDLLFATVVPLEILLRQNDGPFDCTICVVVPLLDQDVLEDGLVRVLENAVVDAQHH